MTKRILVAPLDWGLGHATRCIPIIHALLAMGHEPIIATDGHAYDLLALELPQLQILRLNGYHPFYPENGSMVIAMGRQLPKFIRAIAHERKIVEKWVKQYSIDGIISDNRYGAYSPLKPTAFITHQLNIRVPAWASLLNGPLARLNRLLISPFNRVWIPDWPGDESLAGKLSEIEETNDRYQYIGPISRFGKIQKLPRQYDLLILLSGPEPQRSLLEKKILSQLSSLNKKVLLVQGLISKKERKAFNDNLDVYSYMTTDELVVALATSNLVVARSGYTTIMDMVAIGKQALFIPTPGQTEQEYLAQELTRKEYFYSASQEKLNLSADLEIAEKYFPPDSILKNEDPMHKALEDWLRT